MEINGLPLHPLVVHAAVIFGPLGALAAIGYVLVPSWRDRLRWPMLVLAVVAGLSIIAAYLSGDNFLESRPELEQSPAVETHEELAGKLLWVTVAFSVVAFAAAWLHTRTGPVRIVLGTALAVLAVAVLVLVALTGEAGARAVWG
ncbi:MAG: hypothetical protein JWN22_3432 [Nocardioides sp.]|jgi:uncharacterized membrane protein|nr:hypothetical protein [Nocardioides sp.]